MTDATLTIVNPADLPNPTQMGFSMAVIAPAQTRTAYVSGHWGHDESGATPPEFDRQVTLTYQNLRRTIAALGAAPSDVIKLTVYVVDHHASKLGTLTQRVMEAFEGHLPAQTLIGVDKLAVNGMLFEVEAIVAVP